MSIPRSEMAMVSVGAAAGTREWRALLPCGQEFCLDRANGRVWGDPKKEGSQNWEKQWGSVVVESGGETGTVQAFVLRATKECPQRRLAVIVRTLSATLLEGMELVVKSEQGETKIKAVVSEVELKAGGVRQTGLAAVYAMPWHDEGEEVDVARLEQLELSFVRR